MLLALLLVEVPVGVASVAVFVGIVVSGSACWCCWYCCYWKCMLVLLLVELAVGVVVFVGIFVSVGDVVSVLCGVGDVVCVLCDVVAGVADVGGEGDVSVNKHLKGEHTEKRERGRQGKKRIRGPWE